jgi:hypothetical protein
LSSVVIKTFGLILIAYTIAVFPDRLLLYAADSDQSFLLLLGVVALPSIVPLAIGLALFSLPATVSRVVLGAETQEAEIAKQVQPLIIGGIGLYLALMALLDLIYFGMLQVYSRQEFQFSYVEDPSARAGVFAAFAQLALGLITFFGARGLSGLLRKIRQED